MKSGAPIIEPVRRIPAEIGAAGSGRSSRSASLRATASAADPRPGRSDRRLRGIFADDNPLRAPRLCVRHVTRTWRPRKRSGDGDTDRSARRERGDRAPARRAGCGDGQPALGPSRRACQWSTRPRRSTSLVRTHGRTEEEVVVGVEQLLSSGVEPFGLARDLRHALGELRAAPLQSQPPNLARRLFPARDRRARSTASSPRTSTRRGTAETRLSR